MKVKDLHWVVDDILCDTLRDIFKFLITLLFNN